MPKTEYENQAELTERYKNSGVYGDSDYLSPNNRLFDSFRVGQRVKTRGFEDSSGRFHPVKSGLIIESIRLVGLRWNQEVMEMVPHVRVKAVCPEGLGYFEGAEHFFELDKD